MSLSWLARRPPLFLLCQSTEAGIRRLSNDTASKIARIKNPSRGGQNLTLRYRRLEKMVRGKEVRAQHIEKLPGAGAAVAQTPAAASGLKTFHGLMVPEEPTPPEPDGASRTVCPNTVN